MPTGRFLRVKASASRICKAVLIVVVAAVFVGLGLRHPGIWLHMVGVVVVGACLGVAVIGRLDAWRSGRGKTLLVWPPLEEDSEEGPPQEGDLRCFRGSYGIFQILFFCLLVLTFVFLFWVMKGLPLAAAVPWSWVILAPLAVVLVVSAGALPLMARAGVWGVAWDAEGIRFRTFLGPARFAWREIDGTTLETTAEGKVRQIVWEAKGRKLDWPLDRLTPAEATQVQGFLRFIARRGAWETVLSSERKGRLGGIFPEFALFLLLWPTFAFCIAVLYHWGSWIGTGTTGNVYMILSWGMLSATISGPIPLWVLARCWVMKTPDFFHSRRLRREFPQSHFVHTVDATECARASGFFVVSIPSALELAEGEIVLHQNGERLVFRRDAVENLRCARPGSLESLAPTGGDSPVRLLQPWVLLKAKAQDGCRRLLAIASREGESIPGDYVKTRQLFRALSAWREGGRAGNDQAAERLPSSTGHWHSVLATILLIVAVVGIWASSWVFAAKIEGGQWPPLFDNRERRMRVVAPLLPLPTGPFLFSGGSGGAGDDPVYLRHLETGKEVFVGYSLFLYDNLAEKAEGRLLLLSPFTICRMPTSPWGWIRGIGARRGLHAPVFTVSLEGKVAPLDWIPEDLLRAFPSLPFLPQSRERVFLLSRSEGPEKGSIVECRLASRETRKLLETRDSLFSPSRLVMVGDIYFLIGERAGPLDPKTFRTTRTRRDLFCLRDGQKEIYPLAFEPEILMPEGEFCYVRGRAGDPSAPATDFPAEATGLAVLGRIHAPSLAFEKLFQSDDPRRDIHAYLPEKEWIILSESERPPQTEKSAAPAVESAAEPLPGPPPAKPEEKAPPRVTYCVQTLDGQLLHTFPPDPDLDGGIHFYGRDGTLLLRYTDRVELFTGLAHRDAPGAAP